jgi:hypothetical protein
MVDDDPVAAWERALAERGQWREDMGPILDAHRDELPHPEDIADHHEFDLRPDRPFPVDDFPSPTAWMWEDDDEVDEDLMERADAGWVPLRHFGCGEYDILVLSGPDAGRVWTRTDLGVLLIPEAEMGDRLNHQLGWVSSWEVPSFPSRRDCTAREGRAREKVIKLVSSQLPPKTRVAYASLDGAAVRVNAHLPGAIVRNVDIVPGAKRRTYDARVHTFPVNRPRRVRTVERAGVPAKALGALVTEDL